MAASDMKIIRGRTGRSKAGSKGGKTTAARHGREFYQRIGRIGGSSRGRKEE